MKAAVTVLKPLDAVYHSALLRPMCTEQNFAFCMRMWAGPRGLVDRCVALFSVYEALLHKLPPTLPHCEPIDVRATGPVLREGELCTSISTGLGRSAFRFTCGVIDNVL